MSKNTKILEWKWIIHFLLMLAAGHYSSAQKVSAVSFAVQTETISIPYTRLSPINPGAEIGATLRKTQRAKSTRNWNAYLGWFYHENFDQNIYLRGEYQFSFPIANILAFYVPIGLGYMHSFHAAPVYEQQIDGSFEEKKQFGKPRAILNLGLGLSYTKHEWIEPFVKYEVVAHSPFVSTVPVAPRNFLKIGANFRFN